jgi:ABC-type uncharacterized transport system permease subunit
MPETLRSVIAFTPFESIMHAPTAIYIGKLGESAALVELAKQFSWAAVLYAAGEMFYQRGARHIIVQGG